MTVLALKENPTPSMQSLEFKQSVSHYQKGDLKSAYNGFMSVLQADPNNGPAWLNLGMCLRKMEKFESSLACTKRALELSPENPSYLTNYANCLTDLDRREEALSAHARAFKLKPNDSLIMKNYALSLREFGQFEQALYLLKQIRNLQKSDISIQWDIAITQLYMGNFQEGWKNFESRWQLSSMKNRTLSVPRWNGENLHGKTLLVYEEQGFGDTILCSRYLPLLHAQGAKIILECKKPLHRLFSNTPGIIEMSEAEHSKNPFDYHIPMMSLPRIFKTNLDTIPPPFALQIPPLSAELKTLLDLGKNRYKVGIVWSGSVTFGNNRRRAVRIDPFIPLAEIPHIQLYSLQKGPCEHELQDSGANGLIIDLAPHLHDFGDTAAVLKHLDLVIMTDSAVAHLAGTLNVPIWNLLNARPYWLYLNERCDCPWYPSMRLFRQPEPGDWTSVFTQVSKSLHQISAQ